MKLTKALCSLMIGGALASAQSASAEEVQAQKVASPSLLPGFHGSIDARHYMFKEKTENGDKENPGVQSRLIMGSTFMNDKLDVIGIMAVTAKPATEKISQRRPEINITYSLFGNDNVDLGAGLQILTPHQGSATDGSPGITAALKASPMDLGFAKLNMGLSGEWVSKLSSRAADAPVDVETNKSLSELGLVEGEEGPAKTNGKEDLDAAAEYIANVNLSSGKLSLDVSQWLDQVYNPRYTATDDGIEVSRPVKSSTTQRIKVAYKITDKATLSNEVYLQQGGVFEREFKGYDDNKGLPAVSNVAKVAYSL